MLQRFGKKADVAVILGSGLGAIEDMVDVTEKLPYSDIDALPATSVEGHSGSLFIGNVSRVPMIFFSGRFHLYEGLAFEDVVSPVKLAFELGCTRLLVTQAAGSLRSDLPPANWFLPTDLLSFPSLEPETISAKHGSKERFQTDESFHSNGCLIDEGLAKDLRDSMIDAGISFYEGVLMWNAGPAYETRREADIAKSCGASAVTMSSYPELLAANRFGMRSALLSLIVNYTSNISFKPINHKDVLKIGINGAKVLKVILGGLVGG